MKLEEKLFNSYVDLAEKYSDEINPEQFGFYMIQFTTKMLFDLASDESSALELIKIATDSGIDWHKKN